MRSDRRLKKASHRAWLFEGRRKALVAVRSSPMIGAISNVHVGIENLCWSSVGETRAPERTVLSGSGVRTKLIDAGRVREILCAESNVGPGAGC